MTIKPIGFDLGAFKLAALGPITLKELQGRAQAGIRLTMNTVAAWGQGTPARTRTARKRMILADGRHLHPTKGIGKSERGGYAKRSRRSNTSRS